MCFIYSLFIFVIFYEFCVQTFVLGNIVQYPITPMATPKLILILVLVCVVSCSQIQRRQIFNDDELFTLNQQQYWFSQIIDHSNYQSSATWQQRYFVFDDFFDPATGPIILYICGQAECRGISSTSFTARIAEQTRGLVVSLQHRYYGKSMPFGESSLNLQNIKYLNVGQALRDLAYFLTSLSKSGLYRITPKNPWITIGGSYPGAMASWFRIKYPHLTIGSISSSGVVLAVQNFKMFDEQIYLSAMKSGDYCVKAIRDASDRAEKQVTSPDAASFKALFNASMLSTEEFLFYWSDAIVFQIQYGNRVNFCESLKDKTVDQQFNIIKDIVVKVTPVDYGAFYLKNQIFAMLDGRGARSWIYQSCTEFSYFQTPSDQHPMRSQLLSLDFYKKWCQDIFGTWPYVSRVNNEYGGLNITEPKLIMTNGDEDPWKWASYQSAYKSQIYTKVIHCDNCAHCVDLKTPNEKDAADLVSARSYEMESIKKWIKEHWNSLQA